MQFRKTCAVFALAATTLTMCAADEAADAVAKGIKYFQGKCAEQQALMPPLITALESGDLDQSIEAYTMARPPYEEIETLANSFSDIDADIDARPYAFEYGEDNEDFRGFHRIERDLFRDQDVAAAQAHVMKLNMSVNALCDALGEPERFSPAKSWDGILALAYEVPAKKISSEEEAWSDLSLMIYRSNFKGIWSQYEPFSTMDGLDAKDTAAVGQAYTELQTTMDTIDPENGFEGKNGGQARAYSSLSTKERDEILEGAYKYAKALSTVRDSVEFEEEEEEEKEEVDDAVVESDSYGKETAAGIAYFAEQCKEQQSLFADLVKALDSGDLSKAQNAYRVARPPYEQIETLAGDFEKEDTEIDARPYAFELGELSEDFVGFHKIERQLYRDNDIEGAKKAVPALQDAIDSLCSKLDKGEGFTADSSWKGMLALVFEVPAKKISSEEETWSDLSLMIYRENVKGIQSQYRPFAESLPEGVSADVQEKYEDLKAYLLKVDAGNPWNGTDFRAYSDVSIEQRKGISDRFYAYGQSLRAARSELNAAPVESSEASDEDAEDEPACFPGNALVELQNGASKLMSELQIGDVVRVSVDEFSPVFMFTHKDADITSRYTAVETGAGAILEATPLHMVYANDQLVPIENVKVGDSLQLGTGELTVVVRTNSKNGRGIFNPQTVHGDIVVNGIRASTYTASVEPALAHVLLAPVRSAFVHFGIATSALEKTSYGLV